RPGRPAAAPRLPRVPRGDPGRFDGGPRAPRPRGSPDTRGDRPRGRLHHVAVARARPGPRCRRRRSADGIPRRERRDPRRDVTLLFDPGAFEPLTDAPWNEPRVRDAIQAIVD